MSFFKQLRLILWKNFTIQKRNWIWTVFEIILPILFSCALVALRQIINESSHDRLNFAPYSVTGRLQDDSGITADPLNWEGPFSFEICFLPSKLAYAPKTQLTDAIMDKVVHRMGNFFINVSLPNPITKPPNFPFNWPDTLNVSKQINASARGFADEDTMVNFLSEYFLHQSGASPQEFCRLPFQIEIDGHTVQMNKDGKGPNEYFGGIAFDPDFAKGNHPQVARYKIRMSATARNSQQSGNAKVGGMSSSIDSSWDTDRNFAMSMKDGPRDGNDTHGGKPGYWKEGFLMVQRAMDFGITKHFAPLNSNPEDDHVFMHRYPYPAYKDNPFVSITQSYLPAILMVSFCVSVLYVARNVVLEKEHRLKEYMKIMGLKPAVHWLAHFINNYLVLAIAVFIITALLCSPIAGKKFISLSHWSIVLVFLLLFAAGTVCFAFAVSVCFTKGSAAAGCAFFAWFICYLPFLFLENRYGMLSLPSKLAAGLFMPTAMGWGSYIIGVYEGTGAGLQWSTINKPGTLDDNLTMLHVWAILIVDCLICIFVTWYGSNVNPGQDGVPLPWYFPFTPSYWGCGRSRFAKEVDDIEIEKAFRPGPNFDVEPKDLNANVVIYNMSKVFGSGKTRKVAVNHLNLRMYHGQITAFLGHNGAGKSTTLSMLTGLTAPTEGLARISGMDVATEMNHIRRKLGFCPQYNVLFGQLTVYEHLEFFCKLKGQHFDILEANDLIRKVNLEAKRDTFAMNLSGGMKRKLSMAISLIGASEIVLLDEPTSGMDPGARHETWLLLQEEKKNRTMVLTTHYMEEADLLGDRIAIMAKGGLQCCGSSLFLKNRYGAGYHVTCVFNSDQERYKGSNDNLYDDMENTPPKTDELLNIMRRHSSSAKLVSCIGAEATIMLPFEDKNRFEALFEEIEKRQKALDIGSFGVSLTTMEEVFLRVSKDVEEESQLLRIAAEGPSIDRNNIAPDGIPLDEEFLFKSPYVNTGFRLWIQQFYAMLLKRILLNFRNYWIVLAQIIIPPFCVLMALLINTLLPSVGQKPPLTLNLDAFSPAYISSAYPPNITTFDLSLMNSFYDAVSKSGTFNNVANVSSNSELDFEDFLLKQKAEVGTNTFTQHYPLSGWFGQEYVAEREPPISTSNSTFITGYYNNQPLHTPGIVLSLVDNALYTYHLGLSKLSGGLASGSGGVPERIETINHPLPPEGVDKLQDWLSSGVKEFQISFNLIFGMSFLASGFVVFLVQERVTRAKQLQFLSGIDAIPFWTSAFIWDMISFTIPVAIIMVLFRIFDVSQLVDGDSWWQILVFLLLYGFAVIPQTYCASFIFTESTSAFVKLVIFNIITGIGPMIIVSVLLLLNENAIADTLEWVFFAIFPNFCLSQGIDIYYMQKYISGICEDLQLFYGSERCETFLTKGYQAVSWCCEKDSFTTDNLRWEEPGMGREFFFLGLQGVGYVILLFLIEFGLIRRVIYGLRSMKFRDRRTYSIGGAEFDEDNDSVIEMNGIGKLEDEDVHRERETVRQMARGDTWAIGNTYALLVNNLTKYYGRHLAVDKLSFNVLKTDCFGLLGVNGAGKTSTFQMLTGANPATDGDAIVAGFSIRDNWKTAGREIGYCPQFDALIELLTGREVLVMFSRLRGIPEHHIKSTVGNIIEALGLTDFADRYIKNYSGGMKRKLSLGAALVGEPPLLLLDEPTSGVDPSTRRFVWKILSQIRQRGIAIVISSHSMEECEALCTKIGIMALGQMRCIGTSQHLKSKFGNAYTVLVKVKDNESISVANKQISAAFHNQAEMHLHGSNPPVLQYRLPVSVSTWSRLFGTINRLSARKELGILDYSVFQTTLEQVFLNINQAANQDDVVESTPRSSEATTESLHPFDVSVNDRRIHKQKF